MADDAIPWLVAADQREEGLRRPGSCTRPMADLRVRSSAMGSAGRKAIAGNMSIPYAAPAASTDAAMSAWPDRVASCC
jgi:hypothetical protein